MKRTRMCEVIMAISVFLIAVAAQAQIQPSFFGMGAASSADMPKVTYGTLSHPPLAWTAIEGTGRGAYGFTSMAQFVSAVPKYANGGAQIDLAIGRTPRGA